MYKKEDGIKVNLKDPNPPIAERLDKLREYFEDYKFY